MYSFFLYCIFIIGVKNILFKDIFRDNCFILFIFVLTFLFLSLSSVSAAEYNFTSSNITDDFQSVIDNDTDDELVINLDDGDYSLDQINVSRNATIQGKSRNTKIVGTGNDILFNITSNNVKIINLTITGFDTAIQSNNGDLRIDGNNITTNGICIDIRSVGNDLKGIIIKNNIIVSSIANYNRGAIYISAPDNSHIIISVSLIGNNIWGNSSSDSNGVRIRGAGCSNNITFTNNNITGTYGGIYLYGASSNNTNISFINNNITGESRYGVSFDASSSNNSWFQFSNNKIIGSYGGVVLSVAISSNTNISLTNNNIIGIPNGVHLFSYSSKNTNISFNNNNITGISNKGIQLSSYSSNNTNISFINNNITGTDYGVDLYVYKNSKSQVIFTKNNITGGLYGVYVYSFEGNISGVSFLNNNITSYYGDGFYFGYFESPDRIIPIASINISNFTINYNSIFATNGIGLNFAGLYSKCRVNVTVKYNHINALIGVNITGFNLNSSFDYNWWGVNDITGKTLGIDTVNHFILNVSNLTSLDNLRFGDIVGFAFLVLNTSLVNEGVEYLPYFVVNGTYNGQTFVVDNFSNFTGAWVVSNVGDNVFVATLDSQDVGFTFSGSKLDTNSTISVDDVHVGTIAVISGQLDNYAGNGSDLLNVTVDGNIYDDVVINSTGGWNLTYLTNRTGNITVTVDYSGNDNYTSFSNSTSFDVLKNSTNSTIDVFGDFRVGENISISGVLADEDSGPINNVQITVTVGNESFNVTTNSSGVWSLVYAPLHGGEFLILVNWAGNDNYTGFTNITSFNVTKLATTSSIVIPSNVKVGKSITVSGVLTSGGKPLANTSVLVIVDGKTYKVTTNSLGVWKLSYTPKKAGKSTMKVSYAGDDVFVGFNVSKSFDVIGKAKIKIVKITKIAKVGKYKGFNLYSKTYTIKNLGTALGSKEYTKYFKNWYLEKLSKNSGVKYQFSAKSRVLKVQVKNLGVGKQVKFKILVTFRRL